MPQKKFQTVFLIMLGFFIGWQTFPSFSEAEEEHPPQKPSYDQIEYYLNDCAKDLGSSSIADEIAADIHLPKKISSFYQSHSLIERRAYSPWAGAPLLLFGQPLALPQPDDTRLRDSLSSKEEKEAFSALTRREPLRDPEGRIILNSEDFADASIQLFLREGKLLFIRDSILVSALELTEPIAEVRFHPLKTGHANAMEGLVSVIGWSRTKLYRLQQDKLREIPTPYTGRLNLDPVKAASLRQRIAGDLVFFDDPDSGARKSIRLDKLLERTGLSRQQIEGLELRVPRNLPISTMEREAGQLFTIALFAQNAINSPQTILHQGLGQLAASIEAQLPTFCQSGAENEQLVAAANIPNAFLRLAAHSLSDPGLREEFAGLFNESRHDDLRMIPAKTKVLVKDKRYYNAFSLSGGPCGRPVNLQLADNPFQSSMWWAKLDNTPFPGGRR